MCHYFKNSQPSQRENHGRRSTSDGRLVHDDNDEVDDGYRGVLSIMTVMMVVLSLFSLFVVRSTQNHIKVPTGDYGLP